jgi:hypothetical protein
MFLSRPPAMLITFRNLLKTLFLLGFQGFSLIASNGIFAALENNEGEGKMECPAAQKQSFNQILWP